MSERICKTYCGTYRGPPDDIDMRRWGEACDEVGRRNWLWGQPTDYEEVERVARAKP